MPRKIPDFDLDFDIYVDNSCLSTPMDDDIPQTPPPVVETAQGPAFASETAKPTELKMKDAEQPDTQPESPVPETEAPVADPVEDEPDTETPTPTEQTPEHPMEQESVAFEEQQNTPTDDVPVEEPPTPEAENAVPMTVEAEAPITEEISSEDPVPEPEVAIEVEAEAVPEVEHVEDPAASEPLPESEEQHLGSVEEPVNGEAAIEEPVIEEPILEETPVDAHESSDPVVEEASLTKEEQLDAAVHAAVQDAIAADADMHMATDTTDSTENQERGPHPNFTHRKTSLRTEALIQAAARAVVAKIERRKSEEAPIQDEDEFEHSVLSNASQETYVPEEDAQSTFSDHQSPGRPSSSSSHTRHIPSRSMSSDEGNSSSHNEPDDDVFSQHSARSSICSLDATDLDTANNKTPHATESLSRRDSFASTHSPRAVSGLSMISGFSAYDSQQFIPTARETRMPFRTPSEIRAMQMASPTPSVFNGSSPRSNTKRHSGGPPSISRLGSPSASAQYSPKGRATPTRFKSRKEVAPLVLLHVTLLPLRWVWGEILNGLDAASSSSKSVDELRFEASDQLRTLRDAWRELQECVGDTVLERGILLPHPQNDYEVLEERLLEALELPVRRRARILECGHYLGPANMVLGEEGDEEEGGSDAEDDGLGVGREEKRHWCVTCRNEIRYEQLGPGKVFRVKVYASNGLMKAGAWEACWNEMERVDVEVEPMVDPALQGELEKLGAFQLEQEEHRRQQDAVEMERALEAEVEPTPELTQLRAETPALPELDLSQTAASPSAMQLAPASSSVVAHSRPVSRQTEAIDFSDDRRRRDEERLREIYGDMPAAPPAQLPAPPLPPADPYQNQPPQQHPYQHSQALTMAAPPPPQPMHHQPQPHPHPEPHADPYRPRSQSPSRSRRQQQQRGIVLDENAGFVELLMEAFKVLLRDPKNVAIIVLCVFLVVMMKRPGSGVETGVVVPEVRYQAAEVPVVQVVQPRVEGVEGGKGGMLSVGVPEVVEVEVEETKAQAEAISLVQEPGKQEVEVEVEVEAEALPVQEVVQEEVISDSPVPNAGVDGMVEVLQLSPVELLAIWQLAYPTCGLEDWGADSVAEEETTVDNLPDYDEMDVVAANEEVEGVKAETTEEGVIPNLAEEDAVVENETPPDTEECAAPAETTVDDINNLPEPEEEHAHAQQCEGDNHTQEDDEPPTPSSHSASTTSLFIPGPFITERRTVRVFETVTETVRVSVVTQTETVSTVVTAVPQTVEETVYETETVRITVSVPVNRKGKEKGGMGRVCGL